MSLLYPLTIRPLNEEAEFITNAWRNHLNKYSISNRDDKILKRLLSIHNLLKSETIKHEEVSASESEKISSDVTKHEETPSTESETIKHEETPSTESAVTKHEEAPSAESETIKHEETSSTELEIIKHEDTSIIKQDVKKAEEKCMPFKNMNDYKRILDEVEPKIKDTYKLDKFVMNLMSNSSDIDTPPCGLQWNGGTDYVNVMFQILDANVEYKNAVNEICTVLKNDCKIAKILRNVFNRMDSQKCSAYEEYTNLIKTVKDAIYNENCRDTRESMLTHIIYGMVQKENVLISEFLSNPKYKPMIEKATETADVLSKAENNPFGFFMTKSPYKDNIIKALQKFKSSYISESELFKFQQDINNIWKAEKHVEESGSYSYMLKERAWKTFILRMHGTFRNDFETVLKRDYNISLPPIKNNWKNPVAKFDTIPLDEKEYIDSLNITIDFTNNSRLQQILHALFVFEIANRRMPNGKVLIWKPSNHNTVIIQRANKLWYIDDNAYNRIMNIVNAKILMSDFLNSIENIKPIKEVKSVDEEIKDAFNGKGVKYELICSLYNQ